MKTLLDGIQTAFNASTPLASLFPNGLEVSVAADAEVLPICILTIMPPAPPMYQTGVASPYVENIIGQFSIYSTDPSFVQSIEPLLGAVFHVKQLTIGTDYNLLSIRNGGGNVYRDSDDAKVWRADYSYKFVVERFS